jgi:hypothetical protein
MYLTLAKWVGGIVGGLALAWIVYAGLIRPTTKPNPSTTQKADTIVNYNITARQSFGCSRFLIQRIPDDQTEIQITTGK